MGRKIFSRVSKESVSFIGAELTTVSWQRIARLCLSVCRVSNVVRTKQGK